MRAHCAILTGASSRLWGKRRCSFSFVSGGAVFCSDFASEKVGDTIHVDAGAHFVGDVGVGAKGTEAWVVASVGNHHGEMASRRAADDANVIGIDLEFLRVHPNPTNRVFAVVEIVRPAVVFAGFVIYADADVARLSESGAGDEFTEAVFVPFDPPATVNDHDSRGGVVVLTGLGKIKIQFFLATFSEVIEVVFDGDALGRLGRWVLGEGVCKKEQGSRLQARCFGKMVIRVWGCLCFLIQESKAMSLFRFHAEEICEGSSVGRGNNETIRVAGEYDGVDILGGAEVESG